MYEPRIEAGDLRHLIKIVDPTLRQNAFGGTKIDEATPFATVWASVRDLSGRELFAAQQRVSEVTHKVTIRWLDGVKATQNVWFDDRQFQIQDVQNPDGRRLMLVLLCVERDNSSKQRGGGTS